MCVTSFDGKFFGEFQTHWATAWDTYVLRAWIFLHTLKVMQSNKSAKKKGTHTHTHTHNELQIEMNKSKWKYSSWMENVKRNLWTNQNDVLNSTYTPAIRLMIMRWALYDQKNLTAIFFFLLFRLFWINFKCKTGAISIPIFGCLYRNTVLTCYNSQIFRYIFYNSN